MGSHEHFAGGPAEVEDKRGVRELEGEKGTSEPDPATRAPQRDWASQRELVGTTAVPASVPPCLASPVLCWGSLWSPQCMCVPLNLCVWGTQTKAEMSSEASLNLQS